MNLIQNWKLILKNWLLRIGYLATFYFVVRIFFLVFNHKIFSQKTIIQVINSFISGLKFDLATISVLNLLLPLFLILPAFVFKNRIFSLFEKSFFVLINLPLLLINVPDVEYYKFVGRRTNFEIFSLANDFIDQSNRFALDYWYLIILMLLLSFAFIKFLPNINLSSVPKPQYSIKYWLATVPFSILMIGVHILVFRGGLQEKPLRINQAFAQNDNALGNLSLNSAFTFLTTMDAVGTTKVAYFESQNQVDSLLNWNKSKLPFFEHQEKQNIVIIILESFGREYMAYGNNWKGYTPFLDSLAKKSVFFENNFANGRESMDAVPAIIASIPRLMDEPYITCRYQTNKITGLGTALRAEGYQTSFFHGARNGSMGFEGFSQIAGFQKYNGLNQYPNAKKDQDFDGQWGIMDEPYFQYFVKELTNQDNPFLSVIFSLSSHHPYKIPTHLNGKFPKGELEIHESIGFADYSLKLFFETAAKQPWYKNTLFVLTADHSSLNKEPKYSSEIDVYRTPLIFFHADKSELDQIRNKTNTLQITQQTDIMPSVLNYLNVQKNKNLPFGKSVFSKDSTRISLNYNEGIYKLISKNVYYKMNNEGEGQVFDLATQKPIASEQKNVLDKQLKATIQFYKNGLIDNTWEK